MAVTKSAILAALDEHGPQTAGQLVESLRGQGVPTTATELIDILLYLVPLIVAYDEDAGRFTVPPADYMPRMYRVVDPLKVASVGVELEEAPYDQDLMDNSVFWSATKHGAIHAGKLSFYNQVYYPTLEAYEAALREYPLFRRAAE